MFKVIRTSEGTLTSKGMEFTFNEAKEVSKELFEYLKKTFPNDFKFENVKEKKVVEKTEKTVKRTTKKDK